MIKVRAKIANDDKCFFFFCVTLSVLSKYKLTFAMCDITLGSLNIDAVLERMQRVSLFSFYNKRIALLKMKLNGSSQS